MAGRRSAPEPPERSRLAPSVPAGRRLGAHMSIAGGLARAVESAYRAGCTALQIFTKANHQWAARPLDDAEVIAFRAACDRYDVAPVVAHASYLINLASPNDELWRKSYDAFLHELDRCDRLGISHLIFHPGAHVGAGVDAGVERVARAIDRAHEERPKLATRITIENTAGQGTCVGHRFEEIRDILARVRHAARVAVCLDTCHLLAAGYDIRDPAGYARTFDEVDRTLGVERIEAFHLNDSKKPLGSRVDRHETIGEGEVGLDAFRCLMNDERFVATPMILETPKGTDELRADTRNLRVLVDLVRPAAGRRVSPARGSRRAPSEAAPGTGAPRRGVDPRSSGSSSAPTR